MKNWRKSGLGGYQKQEQTSDSSHDGFWMHNHGSQKIKEPVSNIQPQF
jgi:hypothetical protein